MTVLQVQNPRLRQSFSELSLDLAATPEFVKGDGHGKLLSLAARNWALSSLLERGFSRTLWCRIATGSRLAGRRAPVERNPELWERILRLPRAHHRYGFRRIHALLLGTNLKAARRIWRQEGLRLARKVGPRLKVAKPPAVELTAA